MNTTDRILGESTLQAFDDLIKMSSAIISREHSSETILDMYREYERKHGASTELFDVIDHIKNAANNIEIAQSKRESRFGVGDEDLMQELLDYYDMLCYGDLCYIVIKSVQTGKIKVGGLMDQILRGDAFNEGIDLSQANSVSNPYIDAIANTFGKNPSEVMATAKTISDIENYFNWVDAQ